MRFRQWLTCKSYIPRHTPFAETTISFGQIPSDPAVCATLSSISLHGKRKIVVRDMKFSTDLVGFDRTVHVFDSPYFLMSFFFLCLVSFSFLFFFSLPICSPCLCMGAYVCTQSASHIVRQSTAFFIAFPSFREPGPTQKGKGENITI